MTHGESLFISLGAIRKRHLKSVLCALRVLCYVYCWVTPSVALNMFVSVTARSVKMPLTHVSHICYSTSTSVCNVDIDATTLINHPTFFMDFFFSKFRRLIIDVG